MGDLSFCARDLHDLAAGNCFVVTFFNLNISVKITCGQVD